MEIFSSTTAETIQFISLPLEIIGLLLAVIEVKFPKCADKIQSFIETSSRFLIRFQRRQKRKQPIHIVLIYTLSLLYLAWIFAYFWIGYLPKFYEILIILPFALLFWGSGIFGHFFDWLDKWSNGKGVGALGILLAGIGVLGEVYQVLTIISSS